MARTDRNNPRRSSASDSRMSLMEFMVEYPDDATCLEKLWRDRFSPDGSPRVLPEVRAGAGVQEVPDQESSHRVVVHR